MKRESYGIVPYSIILPYSITLYVLGLAGCCHWFHLVFKLCRSNFYIVITFSGSNMKNDVRNVFFFFKMSHRKEKNKREMRLLGKKLMEKLCLHISIELIARKWTFFYLLDSSIHTSPNSTLLQSIILTHSFFGCADFCWLHMKLVSSFIYFPCFLFLNKKKLTLKKF